MNFFSQKRRKKKEKKKKIIQFLHPWVISRRQMTGVIRERIQSVVSRQLNKMKTSQSDTHAHNGDWKCANIKIIFTSRSRHLVTHSDPSTIVWRVPECLSACECVRLYVYLYPCWLVMCAFRRVPYNQLALRIIIIVIVVHVERRKHNITHRHNAMNG